MSRSLIISKPIGGNILTGKKNGSSVAPKKLPKWFDITNPLLSDKNQGLDNIVSCPKDTSILNAAEDRD